MVLLVAAMVLLSQSLYGAPRPPLPPYPERYQQAWRFDDPAWLMQGGWDTIGLLNLKVRESWSGYALDMSGAGPALLALPLKAAEGRLNLSVDAGTIRFYFASDWSTGGPGAGPGDDVRLLEFGAWSTQGQETFCWLGVDGLGSTVRLVVNGANGPAEILRAPIQWAAGEWHQMALAWSSGGPTVLYLDGQAAASGVGLDLGMLESRYIGTGTPGFCLGSDGQGKRLAQGQFDELYTFLRALTAEELAWNWQVQGKRAALGPITEEEQKSRLEAVTLSMMEAQGAPAGAALVTPLGSDLRLSIAPSGPDAFELTLHNATPGATYQIQSCEDLSIGDWQQETTVEAVCCQNQITVQRGNRSVLFFRALQLTPGVGPQPNRIQTENAITGTTDWQLTNPAEPGWPENSDATTPEIEGFASATSVNVGETITFYVDVRSGTANYTIDIYRMGWYGGRGGRKMGQTISKTNGERRFKPTVDATTGLIDCLAASEGFVPWPESHPLTIPLDWVSGVYLAKLTEQTYGKQSYIIFVVREDCRCSDCLFQCSATTYQAYNPWGGRSLYTYPGGEASKVSFNRPYAAPFDLDFAYATGAGEFLAMINSDTRPGWEYNLVRWLERQGYDVTYCTSIDTHRPWPATKQIKTFLSVGHDEYWSEAMREHVTTARDGGVNLAFLAANVCYWRIHFEDGEKVFSVNKEWVRCDINNTDWGNAECDPCYPNAPYSGNRPPPPEAPYNGMQTDLWRGCYVGNPEISLIGVQYVYNSLSRNIVIPTSILWHWAFDHTDGLFDETYTLPGLLGYEIDGYREDGCPQYIAPQSNIDALGHTFWSVTESDDCGVVTKSGYSDMTMYTNGSGARVFATGSMQWNWGLDDFGFGDQYPWSPSQPSPFGASRVHPAAQQMTHNIFRTFAGGNRVRVTFTNADTITSGNWSTFYRPAVYMIAGWTPDSLPSYVSSVAIQGATPEEWQEQSGDPRALLEPGSGTARIAAAWTTSDTQNSSFTIRISLDDNPHPVAVYCVDWLGTGTLQRMEVFDSSDTSFSNPLDAREVQLPSNGVYFVWMLKGDMVIRVTKGSAMANELAMVSGIFFED